MKQFLLAFSGLLLLFSCATSPRQGADPDLIIFNANGFTADSSRPHISALAITGERITGAGDDEEIKKLAGKETRMMDLQGAFLMPGFIEGHGHFNGLGQSIAHLNLIKTHSWAEITGLVAEKVKSANPANGSKAGAGTRKNGRNRPEKR